LDILGNDWGRVQGVEVLKDLANNPGAGGVAAAGAGMGMGIGAAGAFGSIAQQVFIPAQNGFASQQPTNPTQNTPSGRFTQKSATPVPDNTANTEDPMEVLGKLKKLLDAGLIEQAEYDAKKSEILSRM
jgi:membrane protease subunit (stomatin/prohibitin family)